MTGFRCGQEMLTFPEHLISLPLASSILYPFIIYTLHNLSVLGLCLRIKDWFVCWINLTALSRTYFIIAARQDGGLHI